MSDLHEIPVHSAARLFDLSSRVAVVAGAWSGLGRAMAHGLASAGASVAVAGTNAERCQRD